MSLDIKHLSQHITPNTSGIIWLTDEPLDYKTPGIYEFNYLLDGMLIKGMSENIESKKRNEKSNFFLGKNFGNPLFIGHIVVGEKDDVQIIHNHFKVAESFISKDSTIFIFNRAKNTANVNFLKDLGKKYKDYNFENLNI